MPYRFLLIKLLEHYNPDIVSCGAFDKEARRKLISDLCHDRIEFVYMCEDTSADRMVRENAQESEGFATYFLISLKMHETAMPRKNILLRVIGHLYRSKSVSCVDLGEKYQVITC